MAWSITDVIPPWGDSGERWPDNFDYQGGDQVNEKHLDYLIDGVGTLEVDVRDALEDIDNDQDGVVDAAESISGLVSDIDLNGQDLVDGSTTIFDDGNDWVPRDTVEGETVAYETGHTNWSSSITDEEIHRLVAQSGENVVIERIEFRQKGGGSSSSASVDVYDEDTSTEIGSATLGSTTEDPGSSGDGNTVTVRLTNNTGSVVVGTVRVVGYIQG